MMRLIDYPSMLRDAHGAGAYAGLNALLMAMEGITGAPAGTVEEDGVAAFWRDIGSRWEIDAPDLSARFPNEILSRLRVYLKDGSIVETPVTAARGDPGKPMSAEEFSAKYYALARAGLSETRARAIADTVAALPDVDSCTALLDAVLETPGYDLAPRAA